MIRMGKSFSGRERHCCFLNTGGPQFADISATSGLDFADDGRAAAVVDWDHDGDLDLWVANRTAPRVRFLRNNLSDNSSSDDRHFLAIRLKGRAAQCNRDAIGARLELYLAGSKPEKRIKTLHAGNGYLSQSSKWIHFGLGSSPRIEKLVVRWPDGQSQTVSGLEPDQRYFVTQGAAKVKTWQRPSNAMQLVASKTTVPKETGVARIVLSGPLALPRSAYKNFDGQTKQLSFGTSRPLLLTLWATWCQPCVVELHEFADRAEEIQAAGLDILALNVGATDGSPDVVASRQMLERLKFPFSAGIATPSLLENMDVLQRTVLSQQQPLPLPSSFLLDSQGRVRAIYTGPLNLDRLITDARVLTKSERAPDAELTLLPGRWLYRPGPIKPISVTMTFLEAGLNDKAKRYLKQSAAANSASSERANKSLAKTYHLLGTILMEQGERDEAMSTFLEGTRIDPSHWQSRFDLGILYFKTGQTEPARVQFLEALKLRPDDADMLNKIGLTLFTEGKIEQSVDYYAKALALEPANLVAVRNIGVALQQLARHKETIAYLSKAIAFAPDDAELHYRLANAYSQLHRSREALRHFREALRIRPNWALVANNVAWILATHEDSEVRDGAEAVRLATQACVACRYQIPSALDTLAVAHAAARNFDKAIQTVRQAIQLAKDRGQSRLMTDLQSRLALFESQQPYVDQALERAASEK